MIYLFIYLFKILFESERVQEQEEGTEGEAGSLLSRAPDVELKPKRLGS